MSANVCIVSAPLPFKTTKTKLELTLKRSHQQSSSHLALSSHMLNEFILTVDLYGMELVATQRPSAFT